MRITYRGNGSSGGTVPVDTRNYTAGEYVTIQSPGTMVKDGSTFAGWKCLANNKTYQPLNKVMMFRSTVMEAQWEPACVINYDTLNAVNVEGIPPFDGHKYSIGDKVTVPPHDDLTALQAVVGERGRRYLEGYVTLQGWKIITGAEARREVLRAGDTFTVTGGMVVLQAVWAPNEISITYEINGAEGDTPEIQTSFSGRPTTLAVPTCTKAGYYFGGWLDMATDIVYGAGVSAKFSGCTTLDAVWVPAVVYTVHYDANGASGGTTPPDERSYHGGSLALPDPSKPGGIYKTGYAFAGWVIRDPEFAVFYACDSYSVTQDTTFYARWMPNDESKRRYVSYTSDETNVALDDDPPTDSFEYVDGDFALAKTWSPFKIGRIVTGWKLGDTVYKFGDLVPIQGNITLTAVWETIPPVTLKFSGGEGAEGTVDDIIVNITGIITLPYASSFSRTGYFADGWIAPDGKKVASGAPTRVNLDEKTTELEYTVNWVDSGPEHTVTYISVGHDSGHVPVDPCKYHAGDIIPLAPAGDLRKHGFELAGWYDVENGEIYSIPSNEQIIAYCNDPDRPEYDSVFPTMWCIGDHTLQANWLPVAQLFFGSKGATSGMPPEPIRVRYDDSIRIPDKGTLSKNGYTLVGWKDEATGTIYKVGDIYHCVAPETLTLQPFFQTASVVEYIIPPDLIIANAAWIPKNGYCVNCHSKTVVVPPEMKGNYCWVRSDTGDRITETCEIHDIYSDICLTLTPLAMSNDGDDRWFWSSHWNVERGFTPRRASDHRCGDYLEFPTNTDPEFAGWILNNDERHIYQPGEKVQIFGNAQIRAVYANATHVVTFAYPEGTLAEAPADTEALAEGTLYQLPSGDGIRGPSGTKLLYWYGADLTVESDPPIVRRWYPGEYLRVPVTRTDLDADAKMLNSAGKLVVYPQFGNKFHVQFVDTDGVIMPEDGFVADGVYAEMQAVRTPQITKLDRSAHTDAEWQAAWRIPYRAGSENAYTYAGMFEAEEEDPEGNSILGVIQFVMYGWLFCLLVKHNIMFIGTAVKASIRSTGLPILTTLQYEYDQTLAHEKVDNPLPTRDGFWFEPTTLDDPAKHLQSPCLHPMGWVYVGGSSGTFNSLFGSQYQSNTTYRGGSPITYGVPGTCKWRAVFEPSILVHYSLTDSLSMLPVEPDAPKTYENALNPQWVKHTTAEEVAQGHPPSYDCQMQTLPGAAFDRPTLGTDFTYNVPPKGSVFQETVTACDLWLPRIYDESTGEYNRNPDLSNSQIPRAQMGLWVDAVAWKYNPWATVASNPGMPDPANLNYSKYFVKKEIVGDDGKEYQFYLINFDLRWHPPEFIAYTYFTTHTMELISEQQKFQNIVVTRGLRAASDVRGAYVPGETPIAAGSKELSDMAVYVKGTDNITYGFSHWIIRVGSNMYNYYKEQGIAMEPKYHPGTPLPYVRPSQPLFYLALDAIYIQSEGQAYDEDIPVELDEEFYNAMKKGWKREENVKKHNENLKTLNAYTVRQQNKEATRKAQGGTNQKKKSNGIIDKVITGVKIFCGVAAAAAAIFIGAMCLQHQSATVHAELDSSGTSYATESNVYADQHGNLISVENYNAGAVTQQHTLLSGFNTSTNEAMTECYSEITKAGGTSTFDKMNSMQTHNALKFGDGTVFDELFPLRGSILSPQSPASPSSIRAVYEKLSAATDAKENYEDFKKLIRLDQALDSAAITDTDEQHVSIRPLTKRLVTDDNDHVTLTDGISACFGVMNIGVDELQDIRNTNAVGFNCFGIEEADGFDGLGLAGTPSPHQLKENTAEYAYIKYVPRDPNDSNWYVAGDTFPKDEGKVPVTVRYLTFTNEYDDNAPDSETHTEPDEYREPHETFTVPECGAEAPEGMEFAGWILDENTTTRSIVQPGDTIEQGTCNHIFKALWLPANPTRFPELRNNTVDEAPTDDETSPVPVFPDTTEEEPEDDESKEEAV